MSPWQRTYWVVFAANIVTAVGMLSFLPFFPALLEDLGMESDAERMRWTGLLTGAAPLAAALMGPLWGSLGDRIGRKWMLLRALLAISVFVGGMAFARGPWELLALRVGQGLFSGFIPPSVTLVSVGAPKELQGRITGTLQAAPAVGTVLGPLVGAWLHTHLGFRELFFFVAAAAGTGALLVALFAYEDRSLRLSYERFSPGAVLAGTAKDLGRVVRNPHIRRAAVALATAQLAVGASTPQLLLFVEELGIDDPEASAQATGWLFTSMAAAGVLATPLWGRVGDAFGHLRGLRFASLGAAIALVCCGLTSTFAALLGMRALLGLTNPGVSVAAFGLAATETRDQNRGGVFGAVFSARALAHSLGAMLGGTLAPLFGIRGLFLVAGGAVALGVALRLASRGRPEPGF